MVSFFEVQPFGRIISCSQQPEFVDNNKSLSQNRWGLSPICVVFGANRGRLGGSYYLFRNFGPTFEFNFVLGSEPLFTAIMEVPMKTASYAIGFCIIVLLFSFASNSWAQGGGTGGTGGTGTGGTGTGGTGTGGTGGTTGTNTGGANTGGTGNTGGTNSQTAQPLDLSQSGQLNLAPTAPAIVDLRNQGFVGATGDKIIAQGFIGVSTQLTGGQPAAGASFGGGSNTGTGGGGGAGGGRTTTGGANNALGLGGIGGRNVGGGANSLGNSNQITRRSLRNRLSNQIAVERIQPAVISNRFQSRLDRLPSTTGVFEGVQIQLSSGTAMISGIVESAEVANRIERQLRLEPGVYRIENRLSVKN
jgi:hypothetical protein